MTDTLIVATHSYRGGTGKSNFTANLAYEAAKKGKIVGVIDSDLPSPGIHILFGENHPKSSLNGVLFKKYPLEKAIIDVTPNDINNLGKIFLVPGSTNPIDIAKVIKDGYSSKQLIETYKEFCEIRNLDLLFLDTHPGLSEETLISIKISDLLFILLRPDRQDYQGTDITVDVSLKIGVSEMKCIVNKVINSIDKNKLKIKMEKRYGIECLAVLAQSDEIMKYEGSGLFCNQEPDHDLTNDLRSVCEYILRFRKS